MRRQVLIIILVISIKGDIDEATKVKSLTKKARQSVTCRSMKAKFLNHKACTLSPTSLVH